ncbi:MAG: hypothetical protein ACTS4X_01440 [Candidatus Hodgkinia cicadicola]
MYDFFRTLRSHSFRLIGGREGAIHQLPQGRRGNLFPAAWRSSRQ